MVMDSSVGTTNGIIKGFSKLDKENKINKVADQFSDPHQMKAILQSFWHDNSEIQQRMDEFSENTISNFPFPFGVAPNMLINNKIYTVPMVIEESSVVAAASSSAKFWSERGGFKAEIISTTKVGQVHFSWKGDFEKLKSKMPLLKERLIKETDHITVNMVSRGGGIKNIELVDLSHKMPNYYQLKAYFETVDSMGANFINSCLEEFAEILKDFLNGDASFFGKEKEVEIIMSILSNYTPDCLVKCYVECDIEELGSCDPTLSPEQFAMKFERAIKIAQIDPHRATTHNKGIFNGIDAVVLATGNDFRAVEACGHTFAARNGHYTSLTDVSLENGKFKYSLSVPLALGTVGGLTTLHPLAQLSLEMLGNPKAEELMMIVASVGLANNFGAIKSLITKGIQQGHMKMHLLNILNHFKATENEKKDAVIFFQNRKVSFAKVAEYLANFRN
jgi:hydroxymethylglutaryl-CoA reductase